MLFGIRKVFEDVFPDLLPIGFHNQKSCRRHILINVCANGMLEFCLFLVFVLRGCGHFGTICCDSCAFLGSWCFLLMHQLDFCRLKFFKFQKSCMCHIMIIFCNVGTLCVVIIFGANVGVSSVFGICSPR